MKIRHAAMDDLPTLAAIEAAGYPAAEGASKESIRARLMHFSECFWLLEDDAGKILSFINGLCTDERELRDEMYDHPEMHQKDGRWLMIFSVVTDSAHQSCGYASRVMSQVIEDMKEQHREGIVLTCKERLIGFYARFGFVNEGVSGSTHGDAVWYQMRLKL